MTNTTGTRNGSKHVRMQIGMATRNAPLLHRFHSDSVVGYKVYIHVR